MGIEIGRPRFRAAWFQAVAGLCALVLASGAVPMHAPGDEGHVDALGGATDETVFACLDDHPRAPHVEAARPVQRPACPACLQRLEGRGWLASAARLAGLLEAEAPQVAVSPAVPPRPFSERPAPRGPPLG